MCPDSHQTLVLYKSYTHLLTCLLIYLLKPRLKLHWQIMCNWWATVGKCPHIPVPDYVQKKVTVPPESCFHMLFISTNLKRRMDVVCICRTASHHLSVFNFLIHLLPFSVAGDDFVCFFFSVVTFLQVFFKPPSASHGPLRTHSEAVTISVQQASICC